MTIKEVLAQSTKTLITSSKTAHLDAEVLLLHILKIKRSNLYSNFDIALAKSQQQRYIELVRRRKRREPVAYIINKQSFYGLDFYVDKRVLIPRPETELLVDEALKIIKTIEQNNNKTTIVDVGTGSGCIPISITINSDINKLYAIDISKRALQVAAKNVERYKLKSRIKLLHGDLLQPLKTRVDIITANLPYLTLEQIKATEADVQKYEPKMALLAGKEETTLYEKLLQQAPDKLKRKGIILLEIDPLFSKHTVKIVKKYLPKAKYEIKKDLAKKDRLIVIKN